MSEIAREIWKFPIQPGVQKVEMPTRSQILTVQVQHGEPMLWALVWPSDPTTTRLIATVGTGHPLPTFYGVAAPYIGTFQLADGALVFHVFDLGEVTPPAPRGGG